VSTTAGTLEADLVVDAMGRRSPVPAWIAALGGTPLPERSSECGIIYYCRYYRVRAGASLPDGPWVPGPRGDLGYGAFSTFPGDNGTFAAVIAIPPGDQELKALRNAAAYDAAAATMPALHAWNERRYRDTDHRCAADGQSPERPADTRQHTCRRHAAS